MSTKATLAYSESVHVYRDLMGGGSVVHLRVKDVTDIHVDTAHRNTVTLSMQPEDLRELRRVLNEADLGRERYEND
jgi:hypothetical protein